MNTNVDMYYRFTDENEPTDEQLAVIMQEVGEDVRLLKERLARQQKERLEAAYQRVKEYHGKA
jgi:hypothetical protein